jgi:hypothetical protein
MVKIIAKTFSVRHIFTMCDAFYGAIERKSFKKQLKKQKDWE